MAENDAIWALGCMSGTSMDGVDAAMVKTDGEQIYEFGKTAYRPYSDAERDVIAAAMGLWPGDGPDVLAAEAIVRFAHREVISGFDGVELVGFHGQTLAHDPDNRRTHQVGDGEHLAHQVKLPVIWDFRSADVAAGGQGAPLAPFFHFACARWLGLEDRVCFLNLGGVGNLTYVDPAFDRPEQAGAVLGFDTGPANAPIDDLVRFRTGRFCDYNGEMAAKGMVDQGIVATFLTNDYFSKPPPKSLDRNDFAGLGDDVAYLSDEDATATLVACVVAAVDQGIQNLPKPPTRTLVCGGGRKNPVMMKGLQQKLEMSVEPVEAVDLDGDMLEAQAFAYLAVRAKRGLPISAPSTTGVKKPTLGGRVSGM